MKKSSELMKNRKTLVSGVILTFIALSLIVFELFTPALFLPNQELIDLDFRSHTEDHPDDPEIFCEISSIGTVRNFELGISEIEWEVGISQFFTAWTFNESIPGAPICAYEGDILEVEITNNLDINIEFDIVSSVNQSQSLNETVFQEIIQSGESQTFTYPVPTNSSGTWVYKGTEGLEHGLYGGFVVYSRNETYVDHDILIFQDDFSPPITNGNDYFAVQNGKIFPYSPHYLFKMEEIVRFRVINVEDADVHTIHVHGHTWKNEDGKNLDNELVKPGTAIDRIMTMRVPGMWMYHCHIYDHIAAGMTGMMTVVPLDYEGDPAEYAIELMEEFS